MTLPDYCLFNSSLWWLCMQKSEWASWMQAVFSVLAIVAAIIIAWVQRLGDRRFLKRSQRASAAVAASSMMFEAGAAYGALNGLLDEINATDEDAKFLVPGRILDGLRLLALPSTAQLEKLIPVNAQCAMQLSHGLWLINQLMIELERLSNIHDTTKGMNNSVMRHKHYFAQAHECFGRAVKQLAEIRNDGLRG